MRTIVVWVYVRVPFFGVNCHIGFIWLRVSDLGFRFRVCAN